jgi:hypothetical protein
MPLPNILAVHGGPSFNDIKVIDEFNPQPELPGDVGQPVSVNIDGPGTNNVDVAYTVEPSSPGGPGDPPTFNIPLMTRIHGSGSDAVRVGYHFHTPPGTENGIIAILAPITLDVAGSGMNSVQVAFAADAARAGSTRPRLEIGAALSFHVQGGDRNDLIGLLMGDPNQYGDPNEMGDPDLMPTGSLDVLLAGGGGNDVISAKLRLDPASMGRVTARVLGGAGNDDLTLDIYGVGDPNELRALIDGGPGRNTAHFTPNVQVINCVATE